MSEPLTLEVTWDEATFLEGAKTAYDYDMRHTWRRYMGWFFIALTQFGVVAAVRHGSVGLLLVSTLLVLYWYGLRWPLRKRMLKRFFARMPDAGKRLRLDVGEEGICVDDRCVEWNRIGRAILSDSGYLLEMGDAFLYIPRRSFRNAESRNEFVGTLKQKVREVSEFRQTNPTKEKQ